MILLFVLEKVNDVVSDFALAFPRKWGSPKLRGTLFIFSLLPLPFFSSKGLAVNTSTEKENTSVSFNAHVTSLTGVASLLIQYIFSSLPSIRYNMSFGESFRRAIGLRCVDEMEVFFYLAYLQYY